MFIPNNKLLPNIIGLTLSEAAKNLTDAGFVHRVVSTDGKKSFAITTDYRSDRANLCVVEGKVTKATIG